MFLPLGEAPVYSFIAFGTEVDCAAIAGGGIDAVRELVAQVTKRNDVKVNSVKWISFFTYVCIISKHA